MFNSTLRSLVLTGTVVILGGSLVGDFSPAQAQYFHQDHNHASYKKVRRLFGLHGHVINNGFLVREVDPGSPAAQSGLAAGDFVTVLDGALVTDIEVFCREILEDFADDDDMDMTFVRSGYLYRIRARF